MARIDLDSIRKMDKDRNSVHAKVVATYTIFEDSGKKYIQLDTYGRSGRANPEKISQSFQIDQETAIFLLDLFTEEFGLF